jgi:hypothetical protein
MRYTFIILLFAKYVLNAEKNLKYAFYLCNMQNVYNPKPSHESDEINGTSSYDVQEYLNTWYFFVRM